MTSQSFVLLPSSWRPPGIMCNHWWVKLEMLPRQPDAWVELGKDGYGICPVCGCEFQIEKPTVKMTLNTIIRPIR
jgi:hypothetical protein